MYVYCGLLMWEQSYELLCVKGVAYIFALIYTLFGDSEYLMSTSYFWNICFYIQNSFVFFVINTSHARGVINILFNLLIYVSHIAINSYINSIFHNCFILKTDESSMNHISHNLIWKVIWSYMNLFL